MFKPGLWLRLLAVVACMLIGALPARSDPTYELIDLGVDALLFASIESKKNDVFFWAYSTMSGDVIFSDTLQGWKLPVSKGLDLGLDLGNLDLGSEETPVGE